MQPQLHVSFGARSPRQAGPQTPSFRLASAILTAVLLVFCQICLPPAATAQDALLLQIRQHADRLAPDLAQIASSCPADARICVLIQAGRPPVLALPASLTAGGAAPRPVAAAIDSAGTYLAEVSRDQLAALLQDPQVLHISPDRRLASCQDFAAQTVGGRILSDMLGLQGSGIGVAVLDTGIAPHPDLSGRIEGWIDFVSGKTAAYDDNGHGTHVAGIVAGDGSAAVGGHYTVRLDWMAPKATLIGVKVLDRSGGGSVSTVISAIDWCIQHRKEYKIRVINLSLGHPIAESYRTDPLCLACERAWRAGLLVICAAGNMGRSVPSDPSSPTAYGTILSPGNDPLVITVGATDTRGTADPADDGVASYSSRGPTAIDLILKPDIVAPGNRIESLADAGGALYTAYVANRILPQSYGGTGATRYFRLSGTSMAAPVVAGAAAQLLQADPSLSPDTVKARLMVSAVKWNASDPFTYGAGLLNVPAALVSRIGAPSGAASVATTVAVSGQIGIVYPANSDIRLWGNNIIWGDNKTASRAIYGTDVWGGRALTSSVWTGGITDSSAYGTFADTAILIGGD